MKLRFHPRILWPYLLTFAVYLLLLFVGLPMLRNTIFNQATKTGLEPDFRPLFLAVLLFSIVALLASLLISMAYTNRYLGVLEHLSEAAKELGEGRFQEIVIPELNIDSPELRELGEALRKTAHQTEEQLTSLNKERAMLSAVLSQMTDGVLIADDAGHVQLLNSAAERLFKISNADAQGRSVVEVMRHHSLVELWEETRDGHPGTITLETGPSHIFLQVVGISLGRELPGRTMLLLQDLTQTHHLETVRRDFISNISHELRTPMAGLKALSETLLDGALDDALMARKFVLRIDSEVDNLTQMVNELLELSRIEAGRSNFEFQRINPCALISKSLERMSLQAERVNINLSQDCPFTLPDVFADPNRIAQVFINLIHNAIKFTPPDGHIHLSAGQEGSCVVFCVQDDGVGISRRDQSRVFERFYKADRSRAGGGTGLGLSICKHIVEAHGGRIWVRSEEGQGSQFFFSIPLAKGNNAR